MKLGPKGALGLGLSAFLIWWTLRGVPFTDVWTEIRNGNPWLLGASIFVATSGFLIRAIRWQVLLQPVKPDTALNSRFGAVTIGFMANNLLPARVGEFVRAYALSRMEALSMSGAFGSLVVERFLDGVVLAVFFLLPTVLADFPGAGLQDDGTVGTLIRGMLLVLAGLVVILGALIVWPTRVVALAERGLARLPERTARRSIDALVSFLDSLQVLRRPGLLVPAIAWSFVFWTWHGLSFYLGMLAFGINEGFAAAIFTEATVGFGVALPSAPGFFGTFHFAADWALSSVYGVDAARSLAFAYGYHLGGFFPVTLIGLWYARRIGLSLKDMGRSEEKVEQAVEAVHPEVVGLVEKRLGRENVEGRPGPDGAAGTSIRSASPRAIEVDAPAKVNLTLRVLERQPSGYHQIETVFQMLELSDRLRVEVTSGERIDLSVVGFDAGPDQDNLVVRAARAFLDEGGAERCGLRIELHKRIPAGAGLGGGSSDAAATLRALDRLFPGSVLPDRLQGIAAALGSDVPFFLCGSALALGTGRGERLEPWAPLPEAPVILALPPVHVSTALAYRQLALDRAGAAHPGPAALPHEGSGWDSVARVAVNDFEPVILERHPEVARAHQALLETAPRFVLLSGSGAAVFAVYGAEDEADHAMSLVRQHSLPFLRTRTRAEVPALEAVGLNQRHSRQYR